MKTEMQKLIEELNKYNKFGNFHSVAYISLTSKIQERIKCNQEVIIKLDNIAKKLKFAYIYDENVYYLIVQEINHLKSEIKLGEDAIK